MYVVEGASKGPQIDREFPEHHNRSSDEYDLAELLRKLWRRRWLIAGTAITAVLLALVFVLQVTPRYTAQALVQIAPRQTKVVDFQAVLSGLPADTATLETEMQVMRSRKLAARAVKELQLERNPEFNPALQAEGWLTSQIRSARNAVNGIVATYLGASPESGVTTGPKFGTPIENIDRENSTDGSDVGDLEVEDIPIEGSSLAPIEMLELQNQRVVESFLNRLDSLPEGRSRVIVMTFISEDPFIAASAVNKLADLYIVSQLEAKYEATKRANEWLNGRVEQLREEVDAAERAVEVFREQSGLIQGEQGATLASEQISRLSTEDVLERTKLAEAEARLRQVESLLSSPNGIETANEVLNSQLIRELRQQESEVERRVAELSTEYGERHPTLINARAELQDIRAKIGLEVDRIVQGLRNEVAIVRARTASVSSALVKLKSEVGELNAHEVQLRALEREATASRSLLENLMARSKETASQADFQQADANVLSYAAIPLVPSYPKKTLMLAIALVMGTFLGILLAFVAEQFDHGFRSTEQVEHLLRIRALGLLPKLKGLKSLGKNPETYVLEKPASAYAEAIRKLHTGLLLAGEENKRPKTVLFTSSLPSEGKTTVVASLARMLSSVGQKVLVIDGDLRKPRVHKIFGVPDKPGVVDCVKGIATLDEVIQIDTKSEAHLIPAGTHVVHPPSLLGSEAMERLLISLTRAYDIVLIDAAPVMAVSDSLILARLVDKVVFMVRWKDTRRQTATNGIRQIQDAGGDVAGVLLSLVDVKEHAEYGFGDSGSYVGKIKKYYAG